MQIMMPKIPLREALHYLGWRGTPVEPELIARIQELLEQAQMQLQPRAAWRRFTIEKDGTLCGTAFSVRGKDVCMLLSGCSEAILFASTLGAASERMLLKTQARSTAESVLLDAILSAAIEAVCDHQEAQIRERIESEGLFLTDRFSPGYGDMPLGQSREICEVLKADREIGLTVSGSGLMIPRKSVTAIMGVSRAPVHRRPAGCEACGMRETCAFSGFRKRDI